MSVANPWSEGSPAPTTSHSEAGAPVFWFSQTMALGPHCADTPGPEDCAAAASTRSVATSVRRAYEDTCSEEDIESYQQRMSHDSNVNWRPDQSRPPGALPATSRPTRNKSAQRETTEPKASNARKPPNFRPLPALRGAAARLDSHFQSVSTSM